MKTLDKIREAVNVECDRQGVGDRQKKSLFDTYMVHFFHHDMEMTSLRLREIALQIEWDNNGLYRMLPVSFGGIVGGVEPELIGVAMDRWIGWFNEVRVQMPHGYGDDVAAGYVDPVIKEFLDIHPFSDGNGRTAWLLRVWMLNQWEDPQPLPNYYGEGTDIRE